MTDEPTAKRKRMGRPPKPPGERLEKTGVALRPQDMQILQRLSLEHFIVTGGGDPRALWEAVFKKGERPSGSSAIRLLIDRERARRVAVLHRDWRKRRPKAPAPTEEQLLHDDFVFGGEAPTELSQVLYRLEPHRIVDGMLQRATDHELREDGGVLKPVPKRKRRAGR